MTTLRARATARRRTALDIVRDLDLTSRWSSVGEHHLVGSVALDLVVEPDIDMWLLPTDHPGPCARDLVPPMLRALTPTTRDRILAIKEAAHAAGTPVQGIRVYEAVLDAGVTTYPDFQNWTTQNPASLTSWRPSEQRLPPG